jgi:hypothetical protein
LWSMTNADLDLAGSCELDYVFLSGSKGRLTLP